jgi:hypothetical protein
MSARSQRVLVWWALISGTIWAINLAVLFHMVPPPSATWSAEQIAAFYTEHKTEIRIGAVISSWTAAFLVPLMVVIAIQIARVEGGKRVWAVLAGAGGVMMTIFLVLPGVFWGVAAFTPERSPDSTALMHELGMLTFVTTAQYFIFAWVAMVVICLKSTTVKYSPFPRWFGYYTAWIALMLEAGAAGFLTRTGPFAWDGLLVFWAPLVLLGQWMTALAYLLLRNLKLQEREENEMLVPTPGSAVSV